MKRTPWFPGNTVPARKGWYERDHRGCTRYIDPKDRRINLDLWEPVSDPADILHPGVWYVQGTPYWHTNPLTGRRTLLDDINDASQQHLPWRGLTQKST
jgi:hypothetical protein